MRVFHLIKLLFFIFFISVFSECKNAHVENILTNENKSIKVFIDIDSIGKPYYMLYFNDKLVLDTSYLGLKYEDLDLTNNFKLIEIQKPVVITDSYELFQGKRKYNEYKALQYKVVFDNAESQKLICEFNLSTNGFAYRYIIDRNDNWKILNEQSTFRFPDSTSAWLQPMSVAKVGGKK
ncbi:MAG: glycoside hydrolase family 97 N-terminal domain-containing protein [Saprospiraceae bacterium]